MWGPPPDHPLWKLAQSLIALLALLIIVVHPTGAHHAAVPDMNDLIGVGGVGLAGKLLWQQLWK